MADSQISPEQEIVTRKEAIARGLKRYFTGKPCKNGHVDWRYVCDHSCAACMRAKVARQRKANPEKVKRHAEARKARYHSDPEFRAKRIAETADWASRNKEYVKERNRKRYLDKRDDHLAKCKERWNIKMNDPEFVQKERDRSKARRLANPEEKRSQVRKRRAMLRGAEGSHNAKDIALILDRQGNKCVYCKSDITSGYEVDHIQPISRGGSNWPPNLQCLCKDCNRSKWCKDPIDFAQEKGLLL